MALTFSVRPGANLSWKGEPILIVEEAKGDLSKVVVELTRTKEIKVVRIAELRPPLEDLPEPTVELAAPEEAGWERARQIFRRVVGPLLRLGERRTKADVKRIAEEAGISWSTAYRHLRTYEGAGTLSALMPERPNGGRGKSRLHPEVYKHTIKVIDARLLASHAPSFDDVKRDLRDVFADKRNGVTDLPFPHDNTIKKFIRRQRDKKEARRRPLHNALSRGAVKANWPGAICEMDHGYLDVLVLHPITRQEIGRPWLTLLIDVCTRMVMGLYLSLDPPNAGAAGLCVSHAICMKDEYLSRLKIESEWPWWGKFDVLHMDNAKEFRGAVISNGCDQHSIRIHWRPVKSPNFAAHIERLMGTIATEMKLIPGTTFSNYMEKGDYDSAKNAAMTLAELERYLVTWIVGVYHQREHGGLGMSPLQKLLQMRRYGSEDCAPCGSPEPVRDEGRLRLDFMPFVKRTIQTDGVQIDYFQYQHAVLRKFVNAKVSLNGPARQFIFRRDPRNIKYIYFWNPEVKKYQRIPYRNTALPAMSLAEHRAIVKQLKERGVAEINEDLIALTHKQLRKQIETAQELTRAQLRKEARRDTNNKVEPALDNDPIDDAPDESSSEDGAMGNESAGFEPYVDIELL